MANFFETLFHSESMQALLRAAVLAVFEQEASKLSNPGTVVVPPVSPVKQ